ncbi:MAG: dienelactone hydrolase family protein [Thiohalomonadaceae bacterium]
MTDVLVTTTDAALPGDLHLPQGARGIVLFAHGSGSSRLSSRNRFVAERLNERGLATLLFDLLTPEEHAEDLVTAQWRFDIALLSRRLSGAVDWAGEKADLVLLPIGLFGASTGAAAALNVAAMNPDAVAAVVSRGGRPDLAGALPGVKAPTLLIVGGHDEPVIAMNRSAAAQLGGPHELVIVPGASHLFEEPGALDEVARLAGDWFLRHLHRLGTHDSTDA